MSGLDGRNRLLRARRSSAIIRLTHQHGARRRPADLRLATAEPPVLRWLPRILAAVAAAATLLFLGPVAVAVALLRSSSDAQGPSLAAQLLIAALVLALALMAAAIVGGATRLALRLLLRRR